MSVVVADPREPDWARVHEELRAHKHVTLQLLWQEYREAHPDGYGYSYFCSHYRAFAGRIDVVMRQQHRAGEKLFVDWAGDTLPYIDRQSGEVHQAHLFLAVLGFSNYTFARAYPDERTESFLAAHVAAFEHLGGVPELVVPDYVPGHIIGLLCPGELCGLGCSVLPGARFKSCEVAT